MRGEIDKCPCGGIYFADPIDQNLCPDCKKNKKEYPMYIKTQRYNISVHPRTKLFACHTEKGSDDFETQTGEVTVSGSDYMLKNMSKDSWYVTDAGTQTPVASETSFKLKKNIKINLGVANIEVV
jgi:hypothetical protein